jgi:hypothetical protein
MLQYSLSRQEGAALKIIQLRDGFPFMVFVFRVVNTLELFLFTFKV